jgi:hypothetical protein
MSLTLLVAPTHAFAAKVHYGTSLANVDWLHGTAESLLTITNLLIGEGSSLLFELNECVSVLHTKVAQCCEGLKLNLACKAKCKNLSILLYSWIWCCIVSPR